MLRLSFLAKMIIEKFLEYNDQAPLVYMYVVVGIEQMVSNTKAELLSNDFTIYEHFLTLRRNQIRSIMVSF